MTPFANWTFFGLLLLYAVLPVLVLGLLGKASAKRCFTSGHSQARKDAARTILRRGLLVSPLRPCDFARVFFAERSWLCDDNHP